MLVSIRWWVRDIVVHCKSFDGGSEILNQLLHRALAVRDNQILDIRTQKVSGCVQQHILNLTAAGLDCTLHINFNHLCINECILEFQRWKVRIDNTRVSTHQIRQTGQYLDLLSKTLIIVHHFGKKLLLFGLGQRRPFMISHSFCLALLHFATSVVKCDRYVSGYCLRGAF